MSAADDFLLKHGICRVKGRCLCNDRQVAQRDGTFLFLPIHHGYAFTDAAGGVRRNSGKPTIYVDCPFCGGSLLEEDDL